jgi:hypothetical protein
MALTPTLFVTVKLPVVVPTVVGANLAVSATLCEGASVRGVVAPLMEIPLPLAAICDMVTLEFPVFESCTVCVAELPAFTFPKLTLVGESAMVYAAATPVPFNATVAVGFCASLVIDIAPLIAPAATGANFASNATDCPAEIVTGAANPLMLNPPPVTPIWLTCMFVWPEFFRVTAFVPLPSTSTLPKLNAVVLSESVGVAPPDPFSFT